jgi:maleylacetate reductase
MMEQVMTEFEYTGYAQDILFGAGAINSLPDLVGRYGWKTILLITSASHKRTGTVDTLTSLLGERVSATVDDTQPHVQEEQLNQVIDIAADNQVDAIIGLGGGSVLGMAKATSDAMHERLTGTLAREAPPLEPTKVPTLMIPTTYAGSEMTSVYGVSRVIDGVRKKMTVSGRNIVPRGVIYDPELTLNLPLDITGTSAMNALAHCFEAMYSRKRNPLSSAAALAGIKSIGESLPKVFDDPNDVAARSDLLNGAFLAGSALSQVAMAIHHGTCHVLGGTLGVPHGVANTIVLPRALQFNADAAVDELAEAAFVLDLADKSTDKRAAVQRLIEWLTNLIDELGLPSRLRDVGVSEKDLPAVAEIALAGNPVKNNPREVSSQAEMESFVRSLY